MSATDSPVSSAQQALRVRLSSSVLGPCPVHSRQAAACASSAEPAATTARRRPSGWTTFHQVRCVARAQTRHRARLVDRGPPRERGRRARLAARDHLSNSGGRRPVLGHGRYGNVIRFSGFLGPRRQSRVSLASNIGINYPPSLEKLVPGVPMDIPNDGSAASGTRGFDADAVPGALVGTSTESSAVTRKPRPGIGGDVPAMRRGRFRLSRAICGEGWFAPGRRASRQPERRPTAAREARVRDRSGAGKVCTRPTIGRGRAAHALICCLNYSIS